MQQQQQHFSASPMYTNPQVYGTPEMNSAMQMNPNAPQMYASPVYVNPQMNVDPQMQASMQMHPQQQMYASSPVSPQAYTTAPYYPQAPQSVPVSPSVTMVQQPMAVSPQAGNFAVTVSPSVAMVQQPLPANMPAEFPIQIQELKKNMSKNIDPYFNVFAPESLSSFPFINKQEFEAEVVKYLTSIAKPMSKKFKIYVIWLTLICISFSLWIILDVILFCLGGVPGTVSTVLTVACAVFIGICSLIFNINLITTFKKLASDTTSDYYRKYESQFMQHGYETYVSMGAFRFFSRMKIRKMKK